MSVNTTVVVAKGRIMDSLQDLWTEVGFSWPIHEGSRQLWFPAKDDQPGLIVARARDVPALVARGVADFGVVGLDVLEEYPDAGLVRVLDLQLARCRLVLAAQEPHWPEGPVRVATKYPEITRQFFHHRGHPVETVGLSGSVELAPVIGLAPYIVDVVDTGKTLQQHGLYVVETILRSSAQLVANPGLWRIRPSNQNFTHQLRQGIEGRTRKRSSRASV